jgi:hypothetical protein
MNVFIVLLVALAVIGAGLVRRRLTIRRQAAADERQTQMKLARSAR